MQLLRNNGIIHSDLCSDQEVVEIWNDMAKGWEKSTSYGPINNVTDDVVTFYTSKYRILWEKLVISSFDRRVYLIAAKCGANYSGLRTSP